MSYIDCFLAPVPRANKAAYEELARISAQVLREHGALSVVECWLDESGPDASSYHGATARQAEADYGSFSTAAGAGPDVVRHCTPISRAMSIARVVLPSPGGPKNRVWSSGSPRARAASIEICSEVRTCSCPTNSSSREGRRADSALPSSGSAAGVVISTRLMNRKKRRVTFMPPALPFRHATPSMRS